MWEFEILELHSFIASGALLDRHELDSSVLSSARYDPDQRLLEIEFRTGRIYRYFNVPMEVFRDLLQAQSKGRFFNRFIRDNYQYRTVI